MKNNKEFYAEIGRRIKDKRISEGFSREKLATMSHISDKFLYDIEVGKKGMSADTLHKIAEALEVTSDYLLTGT